jgi:hypothetical protein
VTSLNLPFRLRLFELDSIVKRVTYKPTWKFQIMDEGGLTIPRLQITCKVDDARRPNPIFEPNPFALRPKYDEWGHNYRPTLISCPEMPSPCNEAQFIEWLGRQVMDIEHHEFREWFRLDGKLVDDPHARLPELPTWPPQ